MKNAMVKKIAMASAVAGLLLAYQNCGMKAAPGAGDGSSEALAKSCQDSLKEAYRKTYWATWFRASSAQNNCTSCHDAGGSAGPAKEFATGNLDHSYSVFNSIGRAKVEAMGLNTTHKPPHTGPQNQAFVDNAKATWSAAEAAAAACNGTTEIVTSPKGAPANVYTTTPADTAATAWPRLTWDLDTDVVGATNTVHMTISIEVRRMMDATQTPPAAVGYEFRNPTVTVKSVNGTTPTYGIESLSMRLNGAPYTNMTSYNLLDVAVNSTTGANLAAGAAFSAAPTDSGTVSPTDQFQLRFASIKNSDGTPITNGTGGDQTGTSTRVTFAQLQSANGVFTRTCNSCHNANRRDGNLDITNYAAAVAVASTIRSRMNNSNNPMPPGAILGASDRAMVDAWVASGTPQN